MHSSSKHAIYKEHIELKFSRGRDFQLGFKEETEIKTNLAIKEKKYFDRAKS